jgi:hypothetical protein
MNAIVVLGLILPFVVARQMAHGQLMDIDSIPIRNANEVRYLNHTSIRIGFKCTAEDESRMFHSRFYFPTRNKAGQMFGVFFLCPEWTVAFEHKQTEWIEENGCVLSTDNLDPNEPDHSHPCREDVPLHTFKYKEQNDTFAYALHNETSGGPLSFRSMSSEVMLIGDDLLHKLPYKIIRMAGDPYRLSEHSHDDHVYGRLKNRLRNWVKAEIFRPLDRQRRCDTWWCYAQRRARVSGNAEYEQLLFEPIAGESLITMDIVFE